MPIIVMRISVCPSCYAPLKRLSASTRLQGAISQKAVFINRKQSVQGNILTLQLEWGFVNVSILHVGYLRSMSVLTDRQPSAHCSNCKRGYKKAIVDGSRRVLKASWIMSRRSSYRLSLCVGTCVPRKHTCVAVECHVLHCQWYYSIDVSGLSTDALSHHKALR
jgi:hypothetical protein